MKHTLQNELNKSAELGNKLDLHDLYETGQGWIIAHWRWGWTVQLVSVVPAVERPVTPGFLF